MPKPHGALEAFQSALDERRAADRDVPCTNDYRFISDSPDERRQVIYICRERCYLRALCASAGRRQEHGVWGGLDQSTPSVTKRMTSRRAVEVAA